MNTVNLAWMFMLFSTTLSERSNFPESLSIVTSLKNSSHCPGDKITLRCDIKHAFSYTWFKDGKHLEGRRLRKMNITWNNLNIYSFSKRKHVGSYECEGRGNNQSVRTKAWIKMHDPSCCPQKDIESKCVPFTKQKCPHIKSFATPGRNLKILFGIYEMSNETYDIPTHKYFSALAISWEVPEQGRRGIWGWQINVFGISNNNAGLQRCYQINRARGSIMNINVENLTALLWWIDAETKYHVVVRSLPSYMNYNEISKNIIFPSRCELLGAKLLPCCKSYINASLGSGINNRTTLFWTTQYPPNLNISIDTFTISWIGQNTCNHSHIVLGSKKTNYTFRNLQASCGKYTIKINAKLLHPGIECPVSSLVKLLYISPVEITKPSTETPDDKETTLKVALAVSSIIVAALIVALYLINRKRKMMNTPERLIPEVDNNNDDFKVFILHPGHCEKCKDVVHNLGTLLLTTGYIKCNVDLWVPKSKMVRGPQQWINEMMEENDYVVIPWLYKIDNQLPREGTKDTRSTETTNFFHGLTYKAGMIAGDPNKHGKFFTLYRDHSPLHVLPSELRVAHAFQIPSQIDELVMELIGRTQRRPGLINGFLDVNLSYKNAKTNLVNSIKKCHPTRSIELF